MLTSDAPLAHQSAGIHSAQTSLLSATRQTAFPTTAGCIFFPDAKKDLCASSSAERAPDLEIRSGSELKLNVGTPREVDGHRDRHQNRPGNALETHEQALQPRVDALQIPITANSATERIGRRREVHQLDEQTTSRGENGSAESTERGASAGAARCPPRAARTTGQAHSYASTANPIPFSPPASSAGCLPWALLSVGSGRGQGASGDTAFRPSSKPHILDRLLFLPAFPSRGPWVSVEPVSVEPPKNWP